MKLKHKKVATLAATLITLGSLAGGANAAVITYTDRSAFEAALSTSTLLDFEGLAAGLATNLGTSISFGDLTYANSGAVWSTAFHGAPTIQVGDQNDQNTVISLTAGYDGLGMDLGLLFGAGFISVELRDVTNNLIYSDTLSVTDNDNLGTPATTFFGFINDSGDIGSLTLLSGGFPTTDNVIFGSAATVPEPSSALLLGLGALGFVSRRKRTA